MESFLTPSNITFVIGLLTVIFSVYLYFRSPQVTLEKSDLMITANINQLQKDLANLRDNHIHTLDNQIQETNKALSLLTIEVAKLSTIIDERLPKKSNFKK